MSFITIDGYMLKKFIISGANKLEANKDLVDALNVFPVPDGDTGTNMSLTVLAAALEVSKTNTPNIYDVAKAASSGSLRGARGNSGVILSQLFRGFAKGLHGKEVATVSDLAEAFSKASETAYIAVMKPKEGTILTVAQALCDKAFEVSCDTDDFSVFITEVLKHGNKVLNLTTNMLPQLKQAGVVDAGGKGLMCILEGAYESMSSEGEAVISTSSEKSEHLQPAFALTEPLDIKFAYCTEFFINGTGGTSTEDALKDYLQSVGDSIVVVSDDNLIKVHVHTNNPGKVLERSLKIGTLDNIKIENMRTQHTNKISFSEITEDAELKDIGFVAVSMGSGINDLFLKLGADIVIEGGQTMNPSTEDILDAIEKTAAKNVFVLPNNKNIILAAEQAAKLAKSKNVYVVPSKTVAQGIAVLINHIPDSPETVFENASEAISGIVTGQITYAVRDTVFNDREIKEGNILCMVEGDIQIVSDDLFAASRQLVDKLISENPDHSVLSIYYGEDVTEEQALELEAYITDNYDDHEAQVHFGNQPLYYYIISIE